MLMKAMETAVSSSRKLRKWSVGMSAQGAEMPSVSDVTKRRRRPVPAASLRHQEIAARPRGSGRSRVCAPGLLAGRAAVLFGHHLVMLGGLVRLGVVFGGLLCGVLCGCRRRRSWRFGCVGRREGGEAEGDCRAGRQEGNAGTCRHDMNSIEGPAPVRPGEWNRPPDAMTFMETKGSDVPGRVRPLRVNVCNTLVNATATGAPPEARFSAQDPAGSTRYGTQNLTQLTGD